MKKSDWPVVKPIYKEGIETGIATFETDIPDWEEWDKKFLKNCRLAAVGEEKVIGWAALSPVSQRKVYSGVAEVSIYIKTCEQGKGIGNEFQVNSNTSFELGYTSVAMDNNGDFVIAWENDGQDDYSWGIFARRYDNSGNPLGGEFQVCTAICTSQRFPSAAMDSVGGFVITWESYAQDGSLYGIYTRRYDNNGNPLGDEFLVNSSTMSSERFPSAAMDNGGNFIITWQSVALDNNGYDIFIKRYDNNGIPVGGDLKVNSYITGNQQLPSITCLDFDNFVVAWQSDNQYSSDSDNDIYAKLFQISGTPTPTVTPTITPTPTPTPGDEFQVNTFTDLDQEQSCTAIDNNGNFVVVWQFDSSAKRVMLDNLTMI